MSRVANDDDNHKGEPDGKTCPKCHTWQRLAAYSRRSNGRPMSWCKGCVVRYSGWSRERRGEYYIQHREALVAYAKRRCWTNRVGRLARHRQLWHRRKRGMILEEISNTIEQAREWLSDSGLLNTDFAGRALANDLKQAQVELERRVRQEREQSVSQGELLDDGMARGG